MPVSLFERDLLNPDGIKITRSLSGGREMPADIDIELDNSSGYYSGLIAGGEDLRGKRVKLEVYDQGDTYTQRQLLYPIVDDYEISPTVAKFSLKVFDASQWQDLFPSTVLDPNDSTFSTGTNGTTIIIPNDDQGKAFALPFGYAKYVPLRYVRYDADNDYYDYCCIGPCEATNTDKGTSFGGATKVVVYRDGRVVGASEYTVYAGDGGGDPYPGYFTIRFAREQSNGSANYTITADIFGLKMGGSTAQRNYARVIENCLSDTTWGKSFDVDTDSFDAAATTLDAIPEYSGGVQVDTHALYCDGYVAEQRTFQDVIDDLCFCCFSFIREHTTTGYYEIVVDEYSSTSAASFGSGDGYYENIIELEYYRPIPVNDATKNLIINYRANGWTDAYKSKLEYVVNASIGEDKTYDLWCVRDHRTADIIGKRYQTKEQYGKFNIGLTLGMEARYLSVYDIITATFKYQDSDGNTVILFDDTWQVREVEIGATQFSVDAWTNSADSYKYIEHSSYPTDDEQDETTDYSFTAPSAPTGLAIESSGVRQGSDGNTYAYYRLSCTPPAANCQYIEFGYKQKNATNYQWVTGTESSGTWYGQFEAIIPGQYYYFAARAINNNNAAGYTQGQLAEITNSTTGYLAPGDTTAPSTPTGLSATAGTGKSIVLDWDDSSSSDLSHYNIYRSTTNSFNEGNKIAQAKVSRFTDTAPAYATKYYYWVKAIDLSSNASSATSSVNATTSKIQEADVDDDAITYTKINVSTLESISANVGTLTAGIIQSGSSWTAGIKIDLDSGTIRVIATTNPNITVEYVGGTYTTKAFFWAGDGAATFGAYGHPTAKLYFGVSGGGTLWSDYENKMILYATKLTPNSPAGLDLGDSTNYWGDMYVCDGWYLYKDANNLFNFHYGSYRKFAIDDTYNPTSGQDHGCIYVGDVVYAGALSSSSWTLDVGDKKVSELVSSCADAYAKHDGKKLDPILQKKVELKLKDKNSVGNFETVITKSLDDFVQLAIMGVNELYRRVDVLEKK